MQKENLEILLEDMNSKFELMIEGYQSLNGKIYDLSRKTDERFDLVDFKIDTLNKKIDAVDEKLSKKIDGVAADLKATDKRLSDKIDAVDEKLSKKIDAVAADLKAHRSDTEAHQGVYLVKES